MLILDFLKGMDFKLKKHPGDFEGFYIQQTGDVHQLCKVGNLWFIEILDHFWVQKCEKSEILVHEQKLSMEIRTCGCQIQSPLAFLMVKRPW